LNRRDFQRLALVRLDEARVLLEAENFEGCYYLSGYVIECALKACIAKLTKRHSFPERSASQTCYTHDVGLLLRTANLEYRLEAARRADPDFAANWILVREWTEQSHYDFREPDEVVKLYKAVSDPMHGVLRWLKHYW